MIRPYEVVFIFDSALEDEAIAQKLATFNNLLQADGAEPPQLNHWGRRTLAYAIRKKTTGYYVVANYNTDPTLLPEFERALKLDEAVLRFLVVLNDTPGTPPQVVPARGEEEEEEE